MQEWRKLKAKANTLTRTCVRNLDTPCLKLIRPDKRTNKLAITLVKSQAILDTSDAQLFIQLCATPRAFRSFLVIFSLPYEFLSCF